MASELRVNTLKDASGNNSVGVSYVASGSAKAWLNLDGSATFDASDTEIRDSFNIGSTVDNGPGEYGITFTANIALHYSVAGTTLGENTNGNRGANGIMVDNGTAPTSSGFTLQSARGATASSDGTYQDSAQVMATVHGDLE